MAVEFPIFDGHNDTINRVVGEEKLDFFQRSDAGHIDYVRAVEGGFAGGFFAMWSRNPPKPDAEKRSFSDYATDDGFDVPLPEPLERNYALDSVLKMFAALLRLEKESDGRFKLVRDADTLAECFKTGTMAGILHIEGVASLDTDLETLEVFYAAGLRSLGPVWSRPNAFAHGVPFRFPSSPDTGPGLTDAGKALVKACNRLGVLIDLSHLNEKGFWDVAALSDAPLVATHSNAHAICPITRNLTDKQLEAIRESDGMVGVNFATGFLREDGQNKKDTPLDIVVRHFDYLVEHLGIDRVGFGSDFDGATIPAEIGNVAGLPKLVEALRKAGYDDDALRKLTHENWLRVLRKTWK